MKLFVDLGKTPLAGEFLEKKDVGKEKYYPLKLYECQDCSLVQLEKSVSRDKLFQSFLSSVAMQQHFIDYAKEIKDRFLKKGDFVVEIGSNDGVLLKPLVDMGVKVLGVEPISKIALIARKKGISTYVCFFSTKIAKKIGKKADMVLANNVLAHIEDMDEVMKGIQLILKDDGVLVFEVHYLLDLIEKIQFDTIYHEHINYYSIASLAPFLKKYGFEIFEVKRIPTHSGSIRVYAKQLPREKIDNFKEIVKVHRIKLTAILKDLKHHGKKIIGYGAAGRANTLLSYCEIDTKYLDYIVDESPLRYGRLTPGTHIPVVQPSSKDLQADYILILAWNYKDQIMKKMDNYKGRFIIPLPDVEIIKVSLI